MTRRCSHCSNNGHNSRTCPGRHGGSGGVKLFGVRLTEGVGAIKKSASMGSLPSAATTANYTPSSEAGLLSHPDSPSADQVRDHAAEASGYASDDPGHASCSFNCRNERKKGIPWTEEEHRMFLLGLQKLGKGDWRGIARSFVVSRTPTQVASHAQKYFIRHINASRRKRRSSLFDIVTEMPMDQVPAAEELLLPYESENADKLHPAIRLGYGHQSQLAETSSSSPHPPLESKENIPINNVASPVILPTLYPTLFPLHIPFWPPNLPSPLKEEEMAENHEVLKPIPVLCKDQYANADELVAMTNLSIGEGVARRMEPSALSIKLLESSASRQSAFRRNPSVSRPCLSQNGSNIIHACSIR